MELSDLEKIRFDKIQSMRQAGMEPYPTRSEVTATIAEATKEFEDAENGPDVKVTRATLAGRVRSIRLMESWPLPISKTQRQDPTLHARQRAG
jgi:lysyl-tRNA synthetase class 2